MLQNRKIEQLVISIDVTTVGRAQGQGGLERPLYDGAKNPGAANFLEQGCVSPMHQVL